MINLWIGAIPIYLAELSTNDALEGQLNVGLVRGHAVLEVLSKARSAEIAPYRVEGRAGRSKVLRHVHQYLCLLALHKHVEDVVAKNRVERALRSLRGMMRVEAFNLKALILKKFHVRAMPASKVQHASTDVTEPEELASWKGRTVSIFGSKVRIGIFVTRHRYR